MKEFKEAVVNNFKINPIDLMVSDFKCGGKTFQYSNDESGGIFVWLPSKKLTPNNLAALAHECVHAANMMFLDRGIKPDSDNDESMAYLVGWIFKNCVRRMNK